MTVRVVAIDGPAGSGKSTTARAVAERLGFAHLDSGALYRAVTLAVLGAPVPDSGPAIVGLARSLPVRLALRGRSFRPEVAGVDVSEAIRTPEVTAHVSRVAANPVVREWVNSELRAAAGIHPRGVVLDGRDIGTVVFPDAAVKVFLTATPEERARRRSLQDGRGTAVEDVERVQRVLESRDRADSARAVAPLVAARDAVQLDTTRMSFEEQVEAIVKAARQQFPG